MHALHPFGLRLLPLAFAGIALEIGAYRLARKRPYPWQELAASFGCYALRYPLRLLKPALAVPAMRPLWCIFDNTAAGAATANALWLRERRGGA